MNKAHEWLRYILAIVIIVCFFGLLGLLVWKAIPESNSELLYILVGSLGTMVATIIAFYFGSSKSSEDKTKIIANGKNNP